MATKSENKVDDTAIFYGSNSNSQKRMLENKCSLKLTPLKPSNSSMQILTEDPRQIDYKSLGKALNIKPGTAQVRLFRLGKMMEAQLGPAVDAVNEALAHSNGQEQDTMKGMSPPAAKKAREGKGVSAAKHGSPTAATGRKRKLDDAEKEVSIFFGDSMIHAFAAAMGF